MRFDSKVCLRYCLLALASLILASFQSAYAQPARSCGDIPVEPNIADGSKSSVAQLVANSAEVNAFIERADAYLDCEAALGKMSVNLPEQVQVQRARDLVALTKRRNEIGDEFNAQIAAYQKANPELSE